MSKIPYIAYFLNVTSVFNNLHVRLINPHSHLEKNVIVKGKFSNIKLGRNVIVQSGTVLHGGGKAWCKGAGKIFIGDNSVISPNCVLYGCGPGGIIIGKNFDCGPHAGIYSSRTDYRNKQAHIFKPVIIGDDVVFFSGVTVSPGVTIGSGSVVAAGSVVLHDVPPYTFVAGAPARVVRSL